MALFWTHRKMRPIKNSFLCFLRGGAYRVLFVSWVWAILNAVAAFFYRYKYAFKAVVPRSVKLVGIRNIKVGRNSSIGAGSWLNVNNRLAVGSDVITIGENCIIGRDNFFSSGEYIRLGDYCLTTKNCAFIGSSHIYDDPMKVFSATGTKSTDRITVGVNCFFGYGSKVVGSVTIGHGCIIGANSVVKSDVPPFSLVVGNPAIVVKRYDFDIKKWIRWPTDDDFTEGPKELEYLNWLKGENGFVVQPLTVVYSDFFDHI